LPVSKAKQVEIVAVVNKLFGICTQLEEYLQQAQKTQIHLTDAVVENAL